MDEVDQQILKKIKIPKTKKPKKMFFVGLVYSNNNHGFLLNKLK